MKANKSLPLCHPFELFCKSQGVKALTLKVDVETLHQGELIAGALARIMKIFSLKAQMKLSVSSCSW